MKPLKIIGDFFVVVTGNFVSIIGTVIATATAVVVLTFLLLVLLGHETGEFSDGAYRGHPDTLVAMR